MTENVGERRIAMATNFLAVIAVVILLAACVSMSLAAVRKRVQTGSDIPAAMFIA